MLYLLVIFLLAVVSAGEVVAQSAGSFTRLGFGARGVAMGNALVADISGHGSAHYNPALAPFLPRQSLDVSAAFMTFDRELQFLELATPLRPRAGIAAGLIHAGVRDIDGRDSDGYHTGTFSTDEYAFFVAFGVRISGRVTLGLGFQIFRADLSEEVDPVQSIGMDLGATVKVTDALTLGVVADDLLARYSWEASASSGAAGRSSLDHFPTRLRLGASYQLLDSRLLLTAEYESRFSSVEVGRRRVDFLGDAPREILETERLLLHDSRLRLGAEYQLTDVFAVRGGLARLADSDFGGIKPSAGFMFEQAVGALVVRAGYAFVLEPYALGSMHLVTLRFFL